MDFAQSVFWSELLYYTWQTRVKETLVEDKDGVYGPHGWFTPTSAHENPSFNPFTLKTHQVIIPPLKEGLEKNYCKDKEQSLM